MDQIDIAVHETSRNFPGGLPALARALGMHEQVLRSKCCPTTDTHKLSLREALAMMLQTGDISILVAMADELGCTVARKGDMPQIHLIEAILRVDAEHGDVSRALSDALSDGHLNERERANILKEIGHTQDALERLRSSVNAIPAGPVSAKR